MLHAGLLHAGSFLYYIALTSASATLLLIALVVFGWWDAQHRYRRVTAMLLPGNVLVVIWLFSNPPRPW